MKKTSAKKTASKTVVTKTRTTKRPVAKKALPVKKSTSAPKEETVTLPVELSEQALKKSFKLQAEFDRHLHNVMYHIAYVSAFCFLCVGVAMAAAGLVDPKLLVSSTASSTQNGGEEIVIEDSIFDLMTTIPANLVQSIDVRFTATFAEGVQAKLKTVGGEFTDTFILDVETMGQDLYGAYIPVQEYQPGYYELFIYVHPLTGGEYARSAGQFFMGTVTQEAAYNGGGGEQTGPDQPPEDVIIEDEDEVDAESATDSTDTSDNGEDSSSTTDTSTAQATTNKIINVMEPADRSDEIDPDDLEKESPEADTDLAKEVEDQEKAMQEPAPVLVLSSPKGTVLSETALVVAPGFSDLSSVELYARPINSLNARFVTRGAYRNERWQFIFNTNDIPNGAYEFFVKAKRSGTAVTSQSLRLEIKNAVKSVTTELPKPQAPIETERELVKTVVEQPETPITDKVETVDREANLLLKDHAGELDELLERYAVAKQTGDDILLETARKELQKKREAIMVETLQNERVSDISGTIGIALEEKFADLERRVDTFEQIRRERSSGDSAHDTDGDGISDIDEEKLYSTDPTLLDTDGDGITDGIEIMRGYNPTDAKPEAIIKFESPKESVGLVREDVLIVDDVLAIIDATPDQPEILVATEIRGRGLPNSFVTLYIFSTPTVVTVQTDADGNFIYKFDKELEDGQHDVFVAVTDNAGEIIAQSNPYSFVKEAQAFTPVSAAQSDVLPSNTIIETGGGYGVAVGIGILAFGLILFMLGVSLRNRDEEEPTKNAGVVVEHIEAT